MHTDIEQARFNMIEQQIRTWEVLDTRVLELLQEVPREHFVADQDKGLAFADLEIPIGYGQTMLPPKLQARILQAPQRNEGNAVVELGTGSGYPTGLLARMDAHVDTGE